MAENDLPAKAHRFVRRELRRAADPTKAEGMRAYLKSELPCLGVMAHDRQRIAREVLERFPPSSRKQYERTVLALWDAKHREERHVAVHVARLGERFVVPASLPLYRRLIQEGAWWDLVDETAAHLVGETLRRDRARAFAVLDRWIDDDDLWIRRTAIIAQLTLREETDWRRLSRYCLRRAGEKEFFIRKAIGWALRAYSYVEPERVTRFLRENRDRLSCLSFREGAKALRREGVDI